MKWSQFSIPTLFSITTNCAFTVAFTLGVGLVKYPFYPAILAGAFVAIVALSIFLSRMQLGWWAVTGACAIYTIFFLVQWSICLSLLWDMWS